MPDPLILYSANTRLAYTINEEYYAQAHYVWCNSYFNAESAPKLHVDMPPSSTPCDIYRIYKEDVDRRDLHSDSVKRNRAGLLRGIESKKKAGIISDSQYQELQDMVEAAGLEYFRPVLYVIPYQKVTHLSKPVPLAQRAALFSKELLIEELPRSCFDVLWW